MLSRRSLRIKVMQNLYARHHGGGDALKGLIRSIENAYQLHLFCLHQLTELYYFGEKEVEIKRAKFLPTENDLTTQNILAGNRLIQLLLKSEKVRHTIEKESLHLRADADTTRSLHKEMTESEEFKKYAQLKEPTYNDDRALIVSMVKKIFATNVLFNQVLEEIFINYTDDAGPVVSQLADEFGLLSEDKSIESLLKFQAMAEEKEFALTLAGTYEEHATELQELISPKLVNWDLERVAIIDLMLMKLALCEMMYFPTIPLKVSLNEYIDISKVYSTPKSKEFINGILDNIMKDLKQSGKINKAGRGLVE